MNSKWMIMIVIAALFWIVSGFSLPAPIGSRAEAFFRYLPIESGDPDDVYRATPPPPAVPAQAAPTPVVHPDDPDLVPRQDCPRLEQLARILSLVLFRP